MKKIAVVGYKGRMGRLIVESLEKDYIVFGVGRNDCLDNFDVDLVIDFASHESSVVSAEYCLKRNIPCVIGSTGQTELENIRLDEISKHIKIVKSANFSKGVEVLKKFVDSVLMCQLGKIEIIEKHHKNKKDAPSGTSLEIEKHIKEKFDGEIKITSIREGEEMGEHTIIVSFGDEKITISHNVYSRNAFVLGVKDVVKTLLN